MIQRRVNVSKHATTRFPEYKTYNNELVFLNDMKQNCFKKLNMRNAETQNERKIFN